MSRPSPASASAPPKPKPQSQPRVRTPPGASTSRHRYSFPLPPPPTPRNPKVYYWLFGLSAYGISAYSAYLFFSIRKLPRSPSDPALQDDLAGAYDELAGEYDSKINWSERLMGMGILRWWLARKCEGDLLEMAAGTGRNVAWLDVGGRVRSVTFVDRSGEMLRECRRAFKKAHPGAPPSSAHFLTQPTSTPLLPISHPTTHRKFDTILQTMGLCSVSNPIQELRILGSSCKPTGRIYLLEHGRSGYAWLDDLIDRLAGGRATVWGCWWNRDVLGLVRESGLVIEKVRRFHFGTTYWIECRPPEKGEGEGRVEEVREGEKK